MTLALLHKFVYEFRGNNTCIILDRTALEVIGPIFSHLNSIASQGQKSLQIFNGGKNVQILFRKKINGVKIFPALDLCERHTFVKLKTDSNKVKEFVS